MMRLLLIFLIPAAMKWRFQPEDDVKGSDRTRIEIDGQRPILKKGINPAADGFTAIHHAAWNTGVNIRSFRLPSAGIYIIRFRAAGIVRRHDEVIAGAAMLLENNVQRLARFLDFMKATDAGGQSLPDSTRVV